MQVYAMESEIKMRTIAQNIDQLDQRIQNHTYLTLEQKEKDVDKREQLWRDFCQKIDANAKHINIIHPKLYSKNKLY
jgi:hypothetical protein